MVGTHSEGAQGWRRWGGRVFSLLHTEGPGKWPPDVSSCCLQPEKAEGREPEHGGEQR